MARPKTPPYGKELLSARDRGECPDRVFVVYGKNCWRSRPEGGHSICVPADYSPAMYDWECVAGLPVELLWLDGDSATELVKELAAITAPIYVRLPSGRTMSPIEFLYRVWSHEEETDYLERWYSFYQAVLADMNSKDASGNDAERKSTGG